MLAARIQWAFMALLTLPFGTSATEMPYGQLVTNGFRNHAKVAYVNPPKESKTLRPTTAALPDEAKQLLDELFGRNNSKAMVVVRDSQILYERYSTGLGKRNTPLGYSMSKSLTSLAVGRANCRRVSELQLLKGKCMLTL